MKILCLPIMNVGMSGDTWTVPNVLYDGNTVGWFDSAESYITKAGADLISQWDDKSGEDNHLLQATEADKPTWTEDGVYFPGVTEFMATIAFTFNQPEKIYIVIKIPAYVTGKRFLDGDNNRSCDWGMSAPSPRTSLYAGAAGHFNSTTPLNQFFIARLLINGVNSKSQYNELTAVVADVGANNMTGIRLAGLSGVGDLEAEFYCKEAIYRNIDDTETNDVAIYKYLKSKYSI